ncbi:MAG TPA: hypothetical protein VFZ83_03185 [Acidimicrobiia bacterium]|nr:hypothetical protein [Acidimicrobiia bacterium]
METEIEEPLTSRRSMRVRVVALVALVALAGGALMVPRQGSNTVETAEGQLQNGFLQPLADAGVATEVIRACHYERVSASDPWHLSVRVDTAASVADVVAVLRAQGAVVRDDRDAPIVQQYPGQPSRGWNGVVEPSATGSVLALVKNNVATDEASVAPGWLPICPESRVARA